MVILIFTVYAFTNLENGVCNIDGKKDERVKVNLVKSVYHKIVTIFQYLHFIKIQVER